MDFQHFKYKITHMKDLNPECKDNICSFKKSCDSFTGSDLDLKIRIYDPSKSMELDIDGQDLLIPGSQITGNPADDDNLCYIGIYK